MITIDWETYSRLYPADPEDGFYRLLDDAELRMDTLTANRWRAVTEEDWRSKRVRRCFAEILHLSIGLEQNPAALGITSVSNDGYSESYAKVTPEETDKQARSAALKWLSGTGLVSAL